MSRQLEQLYRQVIMDHYKNPKNKGLSSDENYQTIHLNNPTCGDDIHVQVNIENQAIKDIRHEGSGCSICCSSASVMSETLKDHSVNDALALAQGFYDLLQSKPVDLDLGEAMVYQGVSKFPARIKCASLPWKAFEQAVAVENKTKGEG